MPDQNLDLEVLVMYIFGLNIPQMYDTYIIYKIVKHTQDNMVVTISIHITKMNQQNLKCFHIYY